MSERIRSEADIAAALAALAEKDPRLAHAAAAAPHVPLRLQPAGLPGLLRIVAGQQLSTRAASAVFDSVAAAVAAGLDLDALAEGCPHAARATLEAIPGIGRWSADLYLMFCAGHPDIFPVGDLAVRRGAQRALGLDAEPKPAALGDIALAWSPHRSTAARLMWAVYRTGAAAPRPAGHAAAAPAGFPL